MKVFKKDLGDEELNTLMQPEITALMKQTVPGKGWKKKEDNDSRQGSRADSRKDNKDGSSNNEPSPENKTADAGKEPQFELSDTERNYLESVHEQPSLTVTARAELLGLSAYMNNKIKKGLLEYLLEFPINFGHATRGNVKFMELTEKGYQAIGKPFPPSWDFVCSPEHRFYQKESYRWYSRKGYRCQIEMNKNGKRADLGIIKDGKAIALEFELTPKNAVCNAQKDLEAGFDRVLVACKNTKVKTSVVKKLEEALDDSQQAKVKTLLIQEFQFIKDICGTTFK